MGAGRAPPRAPHLGPFGCLGLPGGAPLDPRFPTDHVLVVATARPELPAGRWLVVSRADDGVRVRLDGALVIDDWRGHLMQLSVHAFELTAPRAVDLRVEYFEVVGDATLSVDVVPDGP